MNQFSLYRISLILMCCVIAFFPPPLMATPNLQENSHQVGEGEKTENRESAESQPDTENATLEEEREALRKRLTEMRERAKRDLENIAKDAKRFNELRETVRFWTNPWVRWGTRLGIALILVVVAGFLLRGQERKRKRRIASWARSNHFAFSSHPDPDLENLIRDSYLFTYGTLGTVFNVTQGNHQGYSITLFDGKSRFAGGERFTGMLVDLGFDIPGWVAASPSKDRFDKAFDNAIGIQVKSESDEFNQQMEVISTDKKIAYAIFHPKMMTECIGYPDREIEYKNTRLAVRWRKENPPYRPNLASRVARFFAVLITFGWFREGNDVRLSVGKLDVHLATVMRVVQLIPDYLKPTDKQNYEVSYIARKSGTPKTGPTASKKAVRLPKKRTPRENQDS